MRLYPWSWERTYDETTETYHYKAVYQSDMRGSITAEALEADPEAQTALLRELTEALINHISLEMENHRALAPHPLG